MAALLSAAGLACALTPPAPSSRPLSSDERVARLDALPPDDRQWVTEFVAPIVTPEEERVFLLLETPEDRARFREAFWARREKDNLPFPLGPGYRYRYEGLRELANSTFDGVRQDAGRMVLHHGEPTSIDRIEACRATFRDLEIWTYSRGSWPGTRRFFFYRVSPGTPRRLFSFGTPDSELLSPGSCRKSMAQLARACLRDKRSVKDPCLPSDCVDTCRIWELYQEIRTLQASSLGGESESAVLLAAPQISTEDLSSFKATSSGLDTAAAPAPSPVPTSTDPNARAVRDENPSRASVPRPAAPERTPEMWTQEAIRDRIIALPKKYRDFLDVAAPIMSEAELVTFLKAKPSERDAFIHRFWRAHAKKG